MKPRIHRLTLSTLRGLALLTVLLGCGGELKETPATVDTDKLLEAWNAYYAAVAEVQTNLLASPTFKIDAAHRAGAIELLQSLVASNVGGMMRGGDGSYPHIRTVLSPSIRLGVDNPDTFYRGATISNPNGAYTYRVWGKLGNASDFLLEQFYGPDPNGAISLFEDDELQTDAEGNFEIFLSAERTGKNWMRLDPTDDLITLLIRDSFTNWRDAIPAQVHIERLGTRGAPSPNLTEQSLIKTIEQATQILLRQGQFWPDFSSRLRLVGENNFIDFRATESLGIPTQFYAAGFFSLEPDAALIVRIADVNAAYCGFQLASFWAASPDWPNRQTSLSWCNPESQAQPAADGSYTFVVSAKDPGVQNWIDTSGFSQGLLYARIQSPADPNLVLPDIETQVIAVDEVPRALSALPAYTNAQREQQISERQAHARARYQTW